MEKRNVTCMVDGCGRKPYSQGYCQSHYKQWQTGGQTVAIRPYRPRDPNRVKYAGLRLTRECVAALKKYARQHGRLSESAVIATILEQWRLKQQGERK